MHKKQLTRILAPCAAVIAVVLIFMAPTAFSQDDMVVVPTSAVATLERPAARFEHDAHNELARIDDCVVCNHGQTDNGETPLMRSYHRQCSSCHIAALKGPITCGECHRN